MSAVEKMLTATNCDSPLEYTVPSRTRPGETHKCELSAYRGNGICHCEFFQFKLNPLLMRRISPEQAVCEGKIKLKPGQRIEDALRCAHLLEARATFTDGVIAAIAEKDRDHEKNSHRSQNPY